ncbi:hypothetical protein G7Y89_g8890 [Cudoniella acicularis]|uniref:Uncharacterized protein n=1 Tax=Cudoniella acicularis TaxID=354080 RepID=A0A8H4W0N1_9HELO|nr:hypothetical protein G7Y89_g8890 [Cudoniella acicularis]
MTKAGEGSRASKFRLLKLFIKEGKELNSGEMRISLGYVVYLLGTITTYMYNNIFAKEKERMEQKEEEWKKWPEQQKKWQKRQALKNGRGDNEEERGV